MKLERLAVRTAGLGFIAALGAGAGWFATGDRTWQTIAALCLVVGFAAAMALPLGAAFYAAFRMLFKNNDHR